MFNKYDIVKHFKHETLNDKQKAAHLYTYQIISPSVNHTETGEELVVYKALYDGRPFGLDVDLGQTFARPAEMFNSDVDHNKYPDIKQPTRFELIRHMDSELPESMVNEFDFSKPMIQKGA